MLPYLRKDSLAGHRTGEANPWPKVQPFLLRLRRPMAVLVVHHTNKSGILRGSAQHEDALDLVINASSWRKRSKGISRPTPRERPAIVWDVGGFVFCCRQLADV